MNGRQNWLFRPSASSANLWKDHGAAQQAADFRIYPASSIPNLNVIPSLRHTTKVHHLFCDQLVIRNGFGRFVYRLGIVLGMVLRGLHLCKSRVHETEHQQVTTPSVVGLTAEICLLTKLKNGGGGPRQNHEHGSNQTPHSGKNQPHFFKALCPVVITIFLLLKNPNPGSDPHTLTLSDPSMLA